jgi:molybdate-binding protein
VPNFIVLCKEEYDRIIQSEIYGQEFIAKVSSQLSGNIFAVRSSASSEDTQISS